MKAAVLGNGPSKELFTCRKEYEFVIGCNIPWTAVDATIVLDKEIIEKWAKNPELIQCDTYFSVDAWRHTDSIKKRDIFRPYLKELITPKYPYHSSGHNACEVSIKLGYKFIDIYGCDSWFSDVTLSHTRKYIKNGGACAKHITGWRNRWKEIIEKHPEVEINFIGYENIYKT
jgi:hypothetical protein